MALQPPVAERLPAHVGAALETGGELETWRRRMVSDGVLGQVQALPPSDVCVGVGARCLACWASESRLGCRQSGEPEFGYAVEGPLLLVSGKRDNVALQPGELRDQLPMLAEPPVEEHWPGQIGTALEIDDDALHSEPQMMGWLLA